MEPDAAIQQYRGIEAVDPVAVAKQRALTEALWSLLTEHGLKDGTLGRIDCYFFAPTKSEAVALGAALGWKPDITESNGALKVRLRSDLVHLTRLAFMELTDVAMIAAHENSCVFDGFEVETGKTSTRSWWKFWQS